jgi:hypothetical protein
MEWDQRSSYFLWDSEKKDIEIGAIRKGEWDKEQFSEDEAISCTNVFKKNRVRVQNNHLWGIFRFC